VAEQQVDLSDLLDAEAVASVLRLSSHRAVSVYRTRYADFPTPAVARGRCLLWLRGDIEAWARRTGRLA
jgi:hypothetical protein